MSWLAHLGHAWLEWYKRSIGIQGSTSLYLHDPHTSWRHMPLTMNSTHSTSLMEQKKQCTWLATKSPSGRYCLTVSLVLYSIQLKKHKIILNPSFFLWVWVLTWTCNVMTVGACLDTSNCTSISISAWSRLSSFYFLSNLSFNLFPYQWYIMNVVI